MRSKTAAVSFRFTAANPPLSSEIWRRLSCESRSSLFSELIPMSCVESV